MVAIVFNHVSIDSNEYLMNKKPFVQIHSNAIQAIDKLEAWGYTKQEDNLQNGFTYYVKGKLKDGQYYRVLAYVMDIVDYRTNNMMIMLEDLGPKGEINDEEQEN